MKPETRLRHWLRDNWRGRIDWVEAGRGGTAGLPDCELSLGARRVPIELKIWQRRANGAVSAPMRPAQRRYHLLAAREKQPTGVLFALPASKVAPILIGLIPGRLCPVTQLLLSWDTVAELDSWAQGAEEELREAINRLVWSYDPSKKRD